MKRSVPFSLRRSAVILLAVLCFVTLALAGSPLICHPFDIGKARSLPFAGNNWNLSGNENYDTRNLVRDTLDILDSGAPVLVRMETLRRATLYARKDPQAAKELFTKLHARTSGSGASGREQALAWFDAGFLAETLNQWSGKDSPNPAAGIDGYSLVKKALTLRGDDPQMEFAAALITLRGPEKEHREHAQKAMAGAKGDPLLARNLASHFLGNEKQTVAEALIRNQGGEGK
ncbi:MAG: hypothetical protein LAP21_08135 [Acidobacteriia bacterium]|nr:hypothetical protein [Terriglobia bacterium]